MALAIIQKTARPNTQPIDQQIEVAISIQVSEHRAGGELSGTSDTRWVGNILEFPSSEIAKQFVRVFCAAQINVAPAVAIHVPQGDPGAVFEDLVVEREDFRKLIGKSESGGAGIESSESGFAFRGDRHRGVAETVTCLPIQIAAAGVGEEPANAKQR